MENKELTIRTSYAGDLSIKWEAVAEITTDASVEVGLSDDTSAHGVVRAAEDGKLSVKAERVAPVDFGGIVPYGEDTRGAQCRRQGQQDRRHYH